MRPALAALLEQQRTIERLGSIIATQQKQIDYIGKVSGLDRHLASIVRKADADNPSQPVAPGSGAQGPGVMNTEDAREPDATADVMAPGAVDGANNDVAADAVTDVNAPGGVMPATPPADVALVTAPVAGTDDLGNEDGGKTYTDIRIKDPASGDQSVMNPWTLGTKTQGRFVAALRLARLRVQAGVEAEGTDDVIAAQAIADSDMSDEALDAQVEALSKVQSSTGRSAKQNLVPRAANRVVPQFAPGLSTQASATVDDGDLFI